MKKAFRLLSLTAVLTLAALSTAHAASGTCRIRCSNGMTKTQTTSTGSACCQLFQSFCGGDGSATWTSGITTTICPV